MTTRFLTNTISLSFAEGMIKLIALIFNLILARLLTPATFGHYNLINAFVAIFTFLPDLGTNLIVVRETASQPRRRRHLIGQALTINSVFSGIAFALIIILFQIYSPANNLLPALILAAATLAVTSLRTVAKLAFDASQIMIVSALFTILNSITSSVLAILGFVFWQNLTGLFLGTLFAALLTLGIEWLIHLRQYSWPKFSFSFYRLLPLLTSGTPLGLAAATALLYTKLDTLILARYLSAQHVGWYSAANLLVFSALQLFNVPLVSAAYPPLSQVKSSPLKLQALTLNLTRLILLWSLPVTFLTWALASPIINFTYGPGYFPAATLLRWLALILPFSALSALYYKILIIAGKEKLYFWLSLTGVIINLIANLILIPLWGSLGAVITALITHFSLFILFALAARPFIKP